MPHSQRHCVDIIDSHGLAAVIVCLMYCFASLISEILPDPLLSLVALLLDKFVTYKTGQIDRALLLARKIRDGRGSERLDPFPLLYA